MLRLFLLTSLMLLMSISNADSSVELKSDNGAAEIKILLAQPFLKAEFIKTRKLKIMSRPFITTGHVLFRPEQGLIWVTSKPIRDILFIGHTGVSQLNIETGKVVGIDNPVVKSASDVFVAIVSLDLTKINQLFDIIILKPSKGQQRYRLSPKDENLSKAISSLVIMGKLRVEEILIQEVGGDSTLVKFNNEQFSSEAFTSDELKLFKMM